MLAFDPQRSQPITKPRPHRVFIYLAGELEKMEGPQKNVKVILGIKRILHRHTCVLFSNDFPRDRPRRPLDSPRSLRAPSFWSFEPDKLSIGEIPPSDPACSAGTLRNQNPS